MKKFLLSFCLIASSLLPAAAEPLKATIEADNVLNTLSPGMQVNADDIVSRMPTQDIWFPIPNVMAGRWFYNESIITVGNQSMREPDKGEEDYGMQVDAQGHVWHTIRLPFVKRSETATDYMMRVDSYRGPVGQTEGLPLTLQTKTTLIYWDKKTRKIRLINKADEIHQLSPIAQGQLAEVENRITHMQQGDVPATIRSVLYQRGNFQPNPVCRESFVNYLRSIGRPELIGQ